MKQDSDFRHSLFMMLLLIGNRGSLLVAKILVTYRESVWALIHIYRARDILKWRSIFHQCQMIMTSVSPYKRIFFQTVLYHSNIHRLNAWSGNLNLFFPYTCVIQQFEYSDSGSVRHKGK